MPKNSVSDLASWFTDGSLCAGSSHGVRDKGALWDHSYEGTNSMHEGSTVMTYHPQALTPYAITLGARVDTYEFWGNIHHSVSSLQMLMAALGTWRTSWVVWLSFSQVEEWNQFPPYSSLLASKNRELATHFPSPLFSIWKVWKFSVGIFIYTISITKSHITS